MMGTSASRPLGKHGPAVVVDAMEKILRGFRGAHAGIDKSDEVTQHVIAEDHADLAAAAATTS